MTEEKFYEIIKEKTGWSINDPNRKFGFIVGVCHPFVDMKGLISANYAPYFTIWKSESGVIKDENIECDTQESMLNKIIEFLNK